MLTPNGPPPLNHREKCQFTCSCGNTHTTSWKAFHGGKIASCGQCEIFLWKSSGNRKFGKLTLVTAFEDVRTLSDKAWWECECGRRKAIVVKSVLRGLTKSCGCLRLSNGKSAQNLKTAKTAKVQIAAEWKKLHPELVDDASRMTEIRLASRSTRTKKTGFCANVDGGPRLLCNTCM
jgi:hypothetical protein